MTHESSSNDLDHLPDAEDLASQLERMLPDYVEKLGGVGAVAADIMTPEQVEEFALEVFDRDEGAQARRAKILKARESGNTQLEQELSEKQRSHLAKVTGEVAMFCGVELEPERARRENKEWGRRLLAKVEEIDPDQAMSDEELFKELGFIAEDSETGELKFRYPEEIMPPHITEKWGAYIGWVAKWAKAEAEFKTADNKVSKIETQARHKQIDRARTAAHDRLTSAIVEFMKIDGRDHDDVRRLVGKMREHTVPNSGEVERYAAEARTSLHELVAHRDGDRV